MDVWGEDLLPWGEDPCSSKWGLLGGMGSCPLLTLQSAEMCHVPAAESALRACLLNDGMRAVKAEAALLVCLRPTARSVLWLKGDVGMCPGASRPRAQTGKVAGI